MCRHCGNTGHEIEKGFTLRGFPPGSKTTRTKRISVANPASSTNNGSGCITNSTSNISFTQEQIAYAIEDSAKTESIHSFNWPAQ